MSKITHASFARLAREVVPGLRDMAEAMGLYFDSIGAVSESMTATVEINGKEERVRITVELNPEEEGAFNVGD